MRCPALFVTGGDDGYASNPATKTFYAVSPSTDKKLLVVPPKQHGVELDLRYLPEPAAEKRSASPDYPASD